MRCIRSAVALVGLGVAGCESDQTFGERQSRIAILPELLDLGEVPIGTEVTGLLTIEHRESSLR